MKIKKKTRKNIGKDQTESQVTQKNNNISKTKNIFKLIFLQAQIILYEVASVLKPVLAQRLR